MLLVPTYAAASKIHGIGCHAAEDIPAGTVIWRFQPGVDQIIPEAVVDALDEPARSFIHHYGYRTPQIPGGWVLPFDHTRFINHDDDPNTDNTAAETRTVRDIAKGEEITCNYNEFTDDTW